MKSPSPGESTFPLWAIMMAMAVVLGCLWFAVSGVHQYEAGLILLATGAGVVLGGAAAWRIMRTTPIAVFAPARDEALKVPRAGRPGDIMRAVIERLPDPVMLLDGDGTIRVANERMRALAATAVAGRHVSAALRAPAVLEAVEKVRAGASAQKVEFVMRAPVERHLEAYVTQTPLGDRGWFGIDQADAVAGTTLDGAGRGAAPEALIVALQDLTGVRRLEQMRVDFVASASHELRTPLASMAGFIETLQTSARDDADARNRFLKIMSEQAARMGRLINDLLSLSRIELNQHVVPSGYVPLRPAVQDVVDAMAPVAQEAGVELVITGSDPGKVSGERDELIQVFQNLVDNAIHYGSSGGRVEISLARCIAHDDNATAQEQGCVSIRDFGPGIEREHIPRLTERFYRADAEQSKRQGGTGLGLAIVKHIVMRHRGTLDIASEIGQGSTFTVRLPLSDSTDSVEDRVEPVDFAIPLENAQPGEPVRDDYALDEIDIPASGEPETGADGTVSQSLDESVGSSSKGH